MAAAGVGLGFCQARAGFDTSPGPGLQNALQSMLCMLVVAAIAVIVNAALLLITQSHIDASITTARFALSPHSVSSPLIC